VSNYIQSTNFATKDALSPGDPLKIVRGTEINTEFVNIAIAVATKLDSTSPVISGATINNSTIGATTPSTGAFTTLSASGATTLSGTTTIANAVLPVIDNIKLGYATTATAAGTTTLTLASPNQQFFTGSTTQTIVLPVTSTLVLGLGYTITNNSTGVLTVQSSGLNSIISIPSTATVKFVCILTSGTTSASWSYAFDGSSNIPYTDLSSISASVSANALTVTLNPCTLNFRSSTLTSGAVLTRLVPTAISVTASSGSTLGTTSGVQSKLAVIAIDNAGTVELAIVNSLTYGFIDQMSLISTTAEGGVGGADSGFVFYSTSARTSVAFRIVGFIESTQATAGSWASAPSNVSGDANDAPAKLSTASGSAPSYSARAWVNFNGTTNNNLPSTYSQSGTTVTVTATAHGLIVGSSINVDITTGTGVDGVYTVTAVTDANTFTYTAGTSLTTSGSITLLRATIRASGNVSSITDNGAGEYTVNFTIAMPDANYAPIITVGSTVTSNPTIALFTNTRGALQTASAIKVYTLNTSATSIDAETVAVAIFR